MLLYMTHSNKLCQGSGFLTVRIAKVGRIHSQEIYRIHNPSFKKNTSKFTICALQGISARKSAKP